MASAAPSTHTDHRHHHSHGGRPAFDEDNYGSDGRKRQLHTMQKFDVILLHNDDEEYDESGCLLPCVPSCRQPMYEAGQMISGYLLVRPSRKITITGVAVVFGARYETTWKEDGVQWEASKVCYREKNRMIVSRHMALGYKWYRFDFEHRLPKALPTSFKQPQGRLVYYASGCLKQKRGQYIETRDTHFIVKGHLDIDHIPISLHEPFVERKTQIIRSCSKQLRKWSSPKSTKSSSTQRILHESKTSVSNASSGGGSADGDSIFASLCVNSQTFCVGQHVIADAHVDNITFGFITVSVKLEQNFTFNATHARRKQGRALQDVSSCQTPRTKTTSNVISSSTGVRIFPHRTELTSFRFVIPDCIPSSIDLPRRLSRHNGMLRLSDPPIKVVYHITLEVTPSWNEDPLCIPIRINIGTEDSGGREMVSERVMETVYCAQEGDSQHGDEHEYHQLATSRQDLCSEHQF